MADHDPEEARRVLAGVVEGIVLRATEDGYVAEVTLKNETAAIAGGRVLEKVSCGGAQPCVQQSSRPVFTRLLLRCRDLHGEPDGSVPGQAASGPVLNADTSENRASRTTTGVAREPRRA